MAKFGQSFIQSLTQPGYSQGMFDLGASIGQAPAVAKEKGRREEMMKKLMSGSPMDQAQLMQQEGVRTDNIDLVIKGRQAQTALEKEAARVGTLSGISDLEVSALKEESPNRLRATAKRIRDTSTEPAAIARAEKLEQKADDLAKQQASLVEFSTESSTPTIDPRVGLAEAEETRKFRVDLSAKVQDPLIKKQILAGNQKAIEKVQGKLIDDEFKTPEKRYDITPSSTSGEYDTAIAEALSVGDGTAATALSSIQESRFPDRETLQEVFDVARTIDPQWDTHSEKASLGEDLLALQDLDGAAGAARLQERLIGAGFPNNVKAAQEMQLLRQNKDLPRRVVDAVSLWATGDFSQATLDDYKAIGDYLIVRAEDKRLETIEKMYADGQTEAADRLLNIYQPDNFATFEDQ
jgi:hypothetical protein